MGRRFVVLFLSSIMPVRKTNKKIYIVSFSAYCLCLICLNISPPNAQYASINQAFDTVFSRVSRGCEVHSMNNLLVELELISTQLNKVALINPEIRIIPFKDLIQEIETAFGNDMCASYQNLPEAKKEVYDEIAVLVNELDILRKKVYSISPTQNRQKIIL